MYVPFVIPADEFSAPIKIIPKLSFPKESWEAEANMAEDSWKRALEFVKK